MKTFTLEINKAIVADIEAASFEVACIEAETSLRQGGDLSASFEKAEPVFADISGATQNTTGNIDPAVRDAFITRIKALPIWGYDQDSGEPYTECARPVDGFVESHCDLMELIEEARKLPVTDATPVAPAATIDMRSLATVIDCARDHVQDVESGLEDGTYEPAENKDLPKKQDALNTLSDWHQSVSLGRSATTETPAQLLRKTLKECLGFVEAWQFHLADTNSNKASAVVGDVYRRASDVYAQTAGEVQ